MLYINNTLRRFWSLLRSFRRFGRTFWKEKPKTKKNMRRKKGRLVKFTEEKNNEILNYNNQLAHLQTQLEKAQSVAVKWESQWTHIQNTAAKKTLLLGRIKMATHNLFMLVNRHLKQNTVIELTEKQLEKIQVFIQDLTQITNEIKRTETAATNATSAMS
ncbi:Coiled-coil domain-containing protein 42 [Desmophyllum pertusum]|uniref:Coiled-coil domain-containing protein 42 n=1 Tax=Desmophyllum pertusum TaxID=174260 RepID=A0A9W9Z477_9CNID|nr:Coiled-coil domain-containing protein 42 [Desmophyllum pertusum]